MTNDEERKDTPVPASKGMKLPTYRRHPLDAIFAPRNIAVIGATERANSVGRTLLWNLISHPFGGAVFPINPKRSNVLGIRSYPTIADTPDQVDLAVIVTPARTVPTTERAKNFLPGTTRPSSRCR